MTNLYPDPTLIDESNYSSAPGGVSKLGGIMQWDGSSNFAFVEYLDTNDDLQNAISVNTTYMISFDVDQFVSSDAGNLCYLRGGTPIGMDCISGNGWSTPVEITSGEGARLIIQQLYSGDPCEFVITGIAITAV